jgi:medium-chain acyl-[acyl-carrier-protein] hydrolase
MIDLSNPPRLRPASTSAWFLRAQPVARPALRLFCFPYAGASAGVFRRWGAAIDPRVEVLGLQLPGHGARLAEAPFDDFELMVRCVADAVMAAASGTRIALFGHSMGALLAFEVACRLREQGGRLPECLFVSGRSAPHLPPARLRTLGSPADFVDELRRLEGTPPEILDNAELLELLMPAIRSDFALLDRWRHVPVPPLPIPLVAMAGRGDAHVALETVDAWSQWTRARFERITYSGSHFFVHERELQVVRDVSSRLTDLLAG